MIHGMVDRPLSLTMAEIRRLPSVSRTLVLECGGNSGSEWQAKTAPDVQRSHGLVSCSEWTGVPLSLVLTEAGVRSGAAWVIAEGADACRMERSIPLRKPWTTSCSLTAKWRGASARARISAAADYPGVGGEHERQVAAAAESYRSALHGPGRNVEVHRPDAGRQSAHLYVPDGSEVGDHVSLGRSGWAGQASMS